MSTNQKLPIVDQLEKVSPLHIVAIHDVADRFMKLFTLHQGGNIELARTAYESEKFHFMKLLQDRPELQSCTKLSLYGCFLDMAVQGLSFDPAMKHAYVVSRNINVGTKNQPVYEKRAFVEVDGRGELIIRKRQGQILYADNPVVVWSCDKFINGVRGNTKFVEHEALHPRPVDAEIVASYVRIVRPDNTVDFGVMDISDVLALKKFSKQPESLAWTTGLKGMVENKTVKHSFRSYPKVKLGGFTMLKTESIDAEDTNLHIDYGFDAGNQQSAPAAEQLPGSSQQPVTNSSQQQQQQQQNQPPQATAQAHWPPQPPADPVDEDEFAQPSKSENSKFNFEDDNF